MTWMSWRGFGEEHLDYFGASYDRLGATYAEFFPTESVASSSTGARRVAVLARHYARAGTGFRAGALGVRPSVRGSRGLLPGRLG